ncbi:MAG TPA: hypothetical protein VFP34_00780 [Microlunatus sp.]|nr:hypothetical protein [Microlunatus sp.]
MPPPASADLSVSTNQRSAKVWQKHAEKTKAYKGYKSVPKQPAPTRGRMVPISGLTAQDVTRRVQTELDNSSPCKYFYDRNQFCTYSLADVPNSKPKKGKKPAKGQPASYVVQITPEQAAMMAVAQLRLPAVAPGIGPDPSINRWNMAAVGYPLWLWADGRTHVGPVSQSVANLYVSLDARLTSVTYEMGDGHTVRCAGPGTKWTRSVKAGQPGSCGYRYTRASLPKGSYTVRAVSHWSVTWVVGGQSGVVPMDQEGTRQLAVGELQVLIR